jgi:hypothetical protein
MEQLIRTLIARLVGRGMEITSILAFIRNVALSITANHSMSLEDLNTRLHLLGWNDFDLDGYTFFLIMAIFEPDPESKLPGSFDGSFNYQCIHELSEEKGDVPNLKVDKSKPLQE